MHELGYQIEFIIGFWLIIAGLCTAGAFGFLALRAEPDSGWQFGWQFGSTFTAGVIGILTIAGIVVMAICAFPYNSHYWKLYSVSGTITDVNTSVQSAGKSISNYYVITLTGHSELFVTENPRILDLKGRHVDLVCHANYVYEGADNYDCNIRSVTR